MLMVLIFGEIKRNAGHEKLIHYRSPPPRELPPVIKLKSFQAQEEQSKTQSGFSGQFSAGSLSIPSKHDDSILEVISIEEKLDNVDKMLREHLPSQEKVSETIRNSLSNFHKTLIAEIRSMLKEHEDVMMTKTESIKTEAPDQSIEGPVSDTKPQTSSQEFHKEQRLHLSGQGETFKVFQDILAEQLQQEMLKLQNESRNERKTLSEKYQSQLQEQQNWFQSLLTNKLDALSEKSEKQHLQLSKELREFRNEPNPLLIEKVDKQEKTLLSLNKLCKKIQKNTSALEKKLENVEVVVGELINSSGFGSKSGTLSEIQDFEGPKLFSYEEALADQKASPVLESKSITSEIPDVEYPKLLSRGLPLSHQITSPVLKNMPSTWYQTQNVEHQTVFSPEKAFGHQTQSPGFESKPTTSSQIQVGDYPNLFFRDLALSRQITSPVFESKPSISPENRGGKFQKLLSGERSLVHQETSSLAQAQKDDEMSEETMVVLGGYMSEEKIESYNTASNVWTTHDSISNGPSDETLAVTLGDVIVIIKVENGRTRSLDFASKRWTELKSPPEYRNGMKAAADGNLVYLTGGDDHFTSCDVYDLNSNQWSEGPNLNVGRWYHGSATLKGNVYCVGGSDGKGKYFTSTEVLDPRKEEKGRWTSVADMKMERYGLGLASCSRFLWAVGGGGDSFCLKVLERYDPVSDSWTKMADMEVGRHYPAVCFFSGKLYAIGGCGAFGQALNYVESYDPDKDEWTQVAPLNQRRWFHASCVVHLPSGS